MPTKLIEYEKSARYLQKQTIQFFFPTYGSNSRRNAWNSYGCDERKRMSAKKRENTAAFGAFLLFLKIKEEKVRSALCGLVTEKNKISFMIEITR